jgi:hypothetical protein
MHRQHSTCCTHLRPPEVARVVLVLQLAAACLKACWERVLNTDLFGWSEQMQREVKCWQTVMSHAADYSLCYNRAPTNTAVVYCAQQRSSHTVHMNRASHAAADLPVLNKAVCHEPPPVVSVWSASRALQASHMQQCTIFS